ncbi:hypothetical protein SPRG_02202 [Saprolegnia parasitica CBS 223.65]|uniref:BAP29/BAP31 transmembrane domain-containing protein n=1 Tax=Saprolegnia parasitica (strain CBS 223.65) TaxID=695850 RepID=A0A067CVV6_SAPPC|nr:hypothetical protein SPRG_02202 [Saprolegnia parasitica CBS 223.65]KDO33395.1 hypothetical protein SPRG_02202 [Saprolegnia parasitica CBS 223.65]|eukprot:XP_012196143.1 hypothetical protein SPRG_02202 [Saprolegnia parasitica CBS 223.65]
MSMWATWTYVLLPPAVVLLMLLTIPFPRMIAKGVVRFVDMLFKIELAGIPVVSVITFLAFVSLAGQTYDLQKRYTHPASRWRSERNWWISALTFTIYWMLIRFQAMKKQLLAAQRRDD